MAGPDDAAIVEVVLCYCRCTTGNRYGEEGPNQVLLLAVRSCLVGC